MGIRRGYACAVIALALFPSLLSAFPAVFGRAFTGATLAQDTRSTREEIERLIDQAPTQRGKSNPTDGPWDQPWKEEDLPASLLERRDFLWDVGGWAKASWTTFDTVFGKDTTLTDYDARAWLKLGYTENQTLYSRFRTFYTSYNTGDSPTGDDDDWQSFRVDQLFYEGRWARTLDLDPSIDLDLTVGRQFFFIGKGLVLSNVLDGARFDARFGPCGGMLMAAQTIHFSPDIDPTVPEDKRESDRNFFGGHLYTTALFDRYFYAYGMAQVDRNHYNDGAQSWNYYSNYFGIGGDGGIPIPGLRENELSYGFEFMFETGRSAADGTTDEEDISAFGWLLDINWLPGDLLPVPTRFVGSYYFGSGDGDRSLQLGTVAGNTPGTEDKALNYFGFANTGYSLAPRLTNLHMFRLNGEARLIEKGDFYRYTRELKVGVSLYSFYKHHQNALITDFTSSENSSYLGTEIDTYIDWIIFSDFDISIRHVES